MKKEKIISLIIAIIIFINSSPIISFAETYERTYVYKTKNNFNIEYHLDKDGLPYRYEKGERVYLLLPLDSLRITDENELIELNEAIKESNERDNDIYKNLIKSPPTSYYNLTIYPSTQPSNIYTQFMTFEANSQVSTGIMKVHKNHGAIRVETANLGKPHWYDNKKVIVNIKYYDSGQDGWFDLHISGKIFCTNIDGYPFTKVSTVEFIKIIMKKADNIVWFDLNVWTAMG